MSGALAAMSGSSGGRALTVGSFSTVYGYGSSYGALSPSEFLTTTITALNWDSANNQLQMFIASTSQPNSGWTSININGHVFLRADASFASTTWWWTGASNPFGTTVGAVLPVNIT